MEEEEGKEKRCILLGRQKGYILHPRSVYFRILIILQEEDSVGCCHHS